MFPQLPAAVRVFLCAKPTDMRKGFDGLFGMVHEFLGQDPLSGHLFLFLNRRRDRVKILFWERDGLVALQRMLFGPRRERLPEAPGQQHLFDDGAPPPPPDESTPPAADDESPSRKRKKGHGRRQIPDHLPRKDVPHDVSPAERVCDCGREKSRIGEDVTEQLEYEPGKMGVRRTNPWS
jgi:transposase